MPRTPTKEISKRWKDGVIIKYLPCKYEYLGLIPRNHIKMCHGYILVLLRLGMQRQEDSEAGGFLGLLALASIA